MAVGWELHKLFFFILFWFIGVLIYFVLYGGASQRNIVVLWIFGGFCFISLLGLYRY